MWIVAGLCLRCKIVPVLFMDAAARVSIDRCHCIDITPTVLLTLIECAGLYHVHNAVLPFSAVLPREMRPD
jgi:hypothetical protein